jgi:hypothetical protein
MVYIKKQDKIKQLQEYREKFVILRKKVFEMLLELTTELTDLSDNNPDTPLISKGRGRPRKPQPVCEPEYMRLP